MISSAKLYLNAKILPERNIAVDDLPEYLSTLPRIDLPQLNYFKLNNISPSLKIEMREEFCEAISNNDYNYLEIKNTSTTPGATRTYFYFVTGKIWKSENCVELQLFQDTANTFVYGVDFHVSGRTKVLREHRDRFAKITIPSEISQQCNIYTDIWHEDDEMYYGHAEYGPFEQLKGLQTYQLTIEPDDEVANFTVNTTTGMIIVDTIGFLYEERWVNFEFRILFELNKIVRKVDFTPEQINPILYRGEEFKILQDINTSWNLIYKNQNDIEPTDFEQVNPVDCFLAPDDPVKVKTGTSAKAINYSSFTPGVYYYISPSNNGNSEIKLTDNAGNNYSLSEYHAYNYGIQTDSIRYIIIHRPSSANYFSVTYISYNKVGTNPAQRTTLATYNSITSLTLTSEQPSLNYATNNISSFNDFTATVNGSFNFATSDMYLNSLESLDRTDSKIIKIIKLPYSPAKYQLKQSGEIEFEGPWSYDSVSSFFKLSDLNAKFNYVFKSIIPDPTEELISTISPVIGAERNPDNESKLLHSEFYYPKFVYDSFGFGFALEAVDTDKLIQQDNPNFEIGFVVTTTINSRFLFYFPKYQLKEYCKASDYDNILPVARNNEVVLYNNQYINYLRTGYNYDVKAKQRTDTAAGMNATLSVIGAISSIGLGIASGNPLLALGGVVAGFSTSAHAIMNVVNNIAASEQNLNSKIDQLKAQATAVAGSDDIDILEAYCENRAKLTSYRVSDKMRKALADLFHYCGYNTGEMKVPNPTTRLYFDYLQAELDITETNNIPDYAIKDITERYKAGVTFLHKVDGTWDWEQNKENWEKSLLGD